MDVTRKPGPPNGVSGNPATRFKPGRPKTGGRRKGTKNRIQKRDLADRVAALERAVADLTRKGWTFEAVGEMAGPAGVSFFDLKPHRCRWALTELIPISDARFCGERCLPGKAWCAEHVEVATREA